MGRVREGTMRGEEDGPRRQGLSRLSELTEYKVAEGQPDVRGWSVVGREGQALGWVEEIIVDPKIMKARYLSVSLRGAKGRANTEHLRLVPIGRATLDREDELVLLNDVDAEMLEGYPSYDGGPIEGEFEATLLRAYMGGMDPGIEVGRDRLYAHEHYDEDRFYNPRRPGPTRFRGKSVTE